MLAIYEYACIDLVDVQVKILSMRTCCKITLDDYQYFGANKPYSAQ